MQNVPKRGAMPMFDIRGHALTGAAPASLSYYETALRQFNLFINDPVASADKALGESPGFVMAQILRAYLHLLGTEPGGVAVAHKALRTLSASAVNEQERGHLAALEALAHGRWHAAARVLEDVSAEHPRDILALQVGQQLDFFRGDARMLRDRIARALPAWSVETPGFHAVLGMHAFGLEEMGQYAMAERRGRLAVELEPRDGWAQHAVAHVLEMQGRQKDGIAWMEHNTLGWAPDSFLAVHNWSHLALYYLDLGDIDKVLTLYDGPIYGSRSRIVMEMLDASAMLWRLQLRGVDVGERWNALADDWQPVAAAGHYAFNDIHAVMAFVGAGRPHSVERVLSAQLEATTRPGDNATFSRDVGRPVVLALQAFGNRNYVEAVRLLREVRNIAHRAGGSHAQRDVLDLTLIEAALRSGQHALAKSLAIERAAIKPESPLARLFLNRAAALPFAA
jgi:tetratricopeptide (TPR) repeat protein